MSEPDRMQAFELAAVAMTAWIAWQTWLADEDEAALLALGAAMADLASKAEAILPPIAP